MDYFGAFFFPFGSAVTLVLGLQLVMRWLGK